MSRIPRFTAEPPGNSTGVGQYHIDLARLLHDEAFGNIWATLGRSTLFPVGNRGVSVHPTGAVLPDVVSGPVNRPPPSVPPAVDRRDVPPDQGVVQTMWKQVGGRWQLTHPSVGTIKGLTEAGMRTMAAELGIPSARQTTINPTNPTSVAAPPATANTPVTANQTNGGSMDLGSLITTLGGAYINAKYADPNPIMTTGYQAANSLVDLPFVDVIADQPSDCGNYVYKKVCGEYKWVKQRKRRKKRLATASDIKDLTALKGVLGNGQALQSWIATHS